MPVSFEDPQFTASYEQSVALYARYQMAIHGDDPSECSESEVLHDYYSAPTLGLHCTALHCNDFPTSHTRVFAAFLGFMLFWGFGVLDIALNNHSK